MNSLETEKLLIEMSAIDNRIVSDLAITAWAEVLGGMTYEAARAALLEHRRTSSEYVTPAHLIAIGTPKRDPDAWMNRSIR